MFTLEKNFGPMSPTRSAGEREQQPSPEELPEQLLHQVQREQSVRDAASHFRPVCGRMVGMLFFEDPPRPYQEVAKELGSQPDPSDLPAADALRKYGNCWKKRDSSDPSSNKIKRRPEADCIERLGEASR